MLCAGNDEDGLLHVLLPSPPLPVLCAGNDEDGLPLPVLCPSVRTTDCGQWFEELGIRWPEDVAGLALAELQEEFPQLNAEELVALRSYCLSKCKKPRLLASVVFPRPRLAPQVDKKWLQAATGSQPPRSSGSVAVTDAEEGPPTDAETGKRLEVAHRLVATCVAGPISWSSHKQADWQDPVWLCGLAESIAARLKTGTLRGAWSTWNKLMEHGDVDDNLRMIQATTVRSFLLSYRARGPTVATGLRANLKWMKEHLNLTINLADPILTEFDRPAPGHMPVQSAALPLQAWKHLIAIAQDGEDTVRVVAALCIRYIVSSLRFAHTKRAVLCPAKCTEKTQVWHVAEGKDGQAFFIAMPTFVQPDWPILAEVQITMEKMFGPEACKLLLPDMYQVSAAGAIISGQACLYARFHQTFRALLQFHPLNMSDDQAAGFSTYSLRRWLPTVSDALELGEHERSGIGNWKDGVARKEPMHVRYSDERLNTSSRVKRLCLLAVNHTLRHKPSANTFPTCMNRQKKADTSWRSYCVACTVVPRESS